MKKLTNKEKEIMEMFWSHGPLFVKEIVQLYPDPKPHLNTVSTQVRLLEMNGYLVHENFSGSFRYKAAITEKEYGKRSLTDIVKSYFNDSYLSAVSAFVKEEKISVDELKELIDQIEKE